MPVAASLVPLQSLLVHLPKVAARGHGRRVQEIPGAAADIRMRLGRTGSSQLGDGALNLVSLLSRRFQTASAALPPRTWSVAAPMIATLLDQIGAPMAVRQNRLGHADAQTTMDYTHAVTADERSTAEQLGKILHATARNEQEKGPALRTLTHLIQ